MDETQYNDTNRAFLQAFLARGTLTFEEAQPILAAIFSIQDDKEVSPADITQADLSSYISAANTAISTLDLEIRSQTNQSTRQRIYALVNTTSDSLTQLATTYSADEIAYVKRLLDFMFETNNTRRTEAMCITSMQAVQLAKANSAESQRRESTGTAGLSQNLTLRDAESMLERLVDEGWLEKSTKGFYTLSLRALIELKGWLCDTYNDDEDTADGDDGPRIRIKMCKACGDIITMGERCAQRECPVRLHDFCKPNFFRVQQSINCPACGTQWDGKHFVGERAITTSEKYLQGKRRSGGPTADTGALTNGHRRLDEGDDGDQEPTEDEG